MYVYIKTISTFAEVTQADERHGIRILRSTRLREPNCHVGPSSEKGTP